MFPIPRYSTIHVYRAQELTFKKYSNLFLIYMLRNRNCLRCFDCHICVRGRLKVIIFYIGLTILFIL